jgi:hypothetical protein
MTADQDYAYVALATLNPQTVPQPSHTEISGLNRVIERERRERRLASVPPVQFLCDLHRTHYEKYIKHVQFHIFLFISTHFRSILGQVFVLII